jgi:hypothetical protein
MPMKSNRVAAWPGSTRVIAVEHKGSVGRTAEPECARDKVETIDIRSSLPGVMEHDDGHRVVRCDLLQVLDRRTVSFIGWLRVSTFTTEGSQDVDYDRPRVRR